MGQLVRQSNLFAAEDWKVIYRSFQDADFRSYDFLRNLIVGVRLSGETN